MGNNDCRKLPKSFHVKDLISRSRLRFGEISVQRESLKLGSVDVELHLKGTETAVDNVTQSGKDFIVFFCCCCLLFLSVICH